MRDRTLGDTVYVMFTTKTAAGVPTTLLGSPVISVYEDSSDSQITSGVSLGVDHDSVEGLNLVTIVATTGNGFEADKEYAVVVTTGTVDSVSYIGTVVGSFSLGKIADSVWDEILTGATHNVATSAGRRLRGIQEFQGYEGGAVWIDTVNGTAGTTDYENGTVENPVDSLADAIVIAASVNISRFFVLPGSSITFAEAHTNEWWDGSGWTLDLGSRDISKTHICHAIVSGTGTTPTGEADFHVCDIGTATVGEAHFYSCGLGSTLTLSAASTYKLTDCHSDVAGSGTPTIDFGAAVGNTALNMRRYSGGLTINNKDGTGTDTMSLEGHGQLIVAASSSGAIELRGHWRVTNTGGATITRDDPTTSIIVIETITDQMVFTKANELDVNTQSINGAQVVGDGDATPWDGA